MKKYIVCLMAIVLCGASLFADGSVYLISSGVYAAASTNNIALSTNTALSLSGRTLNGTQSGALGAFNIGASSQAGIYSYVPLMTTNNVMVGTNVVYSTNITVRYAASLDGSVWISNYFSQVFVAPDNLLQCPPQYTNLSLGPIQFLCVQAVENTTGSVITNMFVQAGTKAGF